MQGKGWDFINFNFLPLTFEHVCKDLFICFCCLFTFMFIINPSSKCNSWSQTELTNIGCRDNKYYYEGVGKLQPSSNLSFPFLKLKLLFPSFDLDLPPQCWFKDSDDSSFLGERQAGLQSFLQRSLSDKEIRNRYVFIIKHIG